MEILLFVFLSLFRAEPVEEIAAIKLGRRADGEVFIMEWFKPKYFSDTCEVYETIMPYIARNCFSKKEKDKKSKKETPKEETRVGMKL